MVQLQVTVIEGRNLKRKDLFSENDPYVQVYLDDKYQKQKTTFYFFGNHLKGQNILHVDVYDKGLIFDDKIGSVQTNLQDLYEKVLTNIIHKLPSTDKESLIISIKYRITALYKIKKYEGVVKDCAKLEDMGIDVAADEELSIIMEESLFRYYAEVARNIFEDISTKWKSKKAKRFYESLQKVDENKLFKWIDSTSSQ